jgi:cytochrome oxidase assembly protein ShyY1
MLRVKLPNIPYPLFLACLGRVRTFLLSESISMPTTVGLSMCSNAFFGSLCASTSGFGCWQLQRLYKKMEKVDDCNRQLGLDPTLSWDLSENPFQWRQIKGTFLHHKEVLMGLWGAPAGVSVPWQDMSKGRTGSGQSGMPPRPQGYHFLMPLQVNDDNTNRNSRMVWINRGWAPKTMVPNTSNRDSMIRIETTPDQAINSWSRPKGPVQ